MNIYGKDKLPKLEQPKNKKYYFSSAKSYTAADPSTKETTIKSELNTLASDIEDAVINFNKQLEMLETSFGVNFIAINNKPLGFVDVEAFNTLTKTLTSSIENSEVNTETLFSKCKSTTEEINNWLTELQTNYDVLVQYEKQYIKCLSSNDEEYKAQAATYQSLMNEYQKLPDEPLNYGSWIKE